MSDQSFKELKKLETTQCHEWLPGAPIKDMPAENEAVKSDIENEKLISSIKKVTQNSTPANAAQNRALRGK